MKRQFEEWLQCLIGVAVGSFFFWALYHHNQDFFEGTISKSAWRLIPLLIGVIVLWIMYEFGRWHERTHRKD